MRLGFGFLEKRRLQVLKRFAWGLLSEYRRYLRGILHFRSETSK